MTVPKKSGKLARKIFNLPLKTQLMLIYGVLMGALTIFSSLLIYSEIEHANQHQADTMGNLISGQTASAAANMLVTGDRLSLSVLLNRLAQDPYISEASIYSIDDRRIGHAVSKGDNASERDGPIYSAPINYQDVIAGYVRLSLNQKLLTQKPKEAIQIIIAVSSILLIVGMVFLYFYSDNLARKLSLIERQLHSVLPLQSSPPEGSGEIDRIANLVEQQLTETRLLSNKENVDHADDKVTAIISINVKNIARFQQLLAPQDLMNIIQLQMEIAVEAASLYEGSLSYSPEGNVYIQFVSTESDSFAMDALCCGLLIEMLSQRIGEQSIASIKPGIGLCLSDKIPEFPKEKHPALCDSAASQALMLASLLESNGLHMLRSQLSWLPADITEIQASEHGDGIVLISAISESTSTELERQADALEESLLG
ncbi:MAG: hypothetical protein QS748_09755 [Candidatus Endonucleobacter bathymodioli]|uniref:Uncharacterized protein n=1 Tax=Candidatus Endonucleibacter bathymodioli TaxID=539814 RepID=A0AA90NU77_9GAMM|nr:hypothetical protein [Candidatus Endonucleobacter bathymodioli]